MAYEKQKQLEFGQYLYGLNPDIKELIQKEKKLIKIHQRERDIHMLVPQIKTDLVPSWLYIGDFAGNVENCYTCKKINK